MTALVDEERLEEAPPEECRPPRITPRPTAEIRAQLRTAKTLWCPGCSNGIITRALIDAVLNLGLDPDRVVVVAGIGCSGRISAYLRYSTVHTAHGRALAVATGIKAVNPDLHVVVAMGDGDCAAIGGNHLIHAARRNLPMAVLCANNETYGMTGGQVTPTTPTGARTATTPDGNPDRAFDLVRLVEAAGATYVARYSVAHTRPLIRAIRRALAHPGFAFIEVLSPCPTQAGRRNRLGTPAEMLRALQQRCVPLSRARQMPAEELAGKVLIGEFVGGSES